VDPTYTAVAKTDLRQSVEIAPAERQRYAAKWSIINSTLCCNDVIIYFSARTAGVRRVEQFLMPYRGRLFSQSRVPGGDIQVHNGADTTARTGYRGRDVKV